MDGNQTTRGKRLAHWLRLQVRRVVRENSTPARSGLGFALGSFIGVFPSFLIGSPLAFFLAGRFGWNRPAAVAGTFLMNPVTAPIFYWISTWLGLEVLGRGVETAQIGTGAGAGADTAGVLTTRGDAAVIGSESVVTFQLSDPVTVRAN